MSSPRQAAPRAAPWVIMTGAPHPHEVLAALYDEHHTAVYAYLARRLPKDDVDDAVLETFLVAWRRLDACTTAPQPQWWLLATARRVAANTRRAATRRRALLDRARSAPPAPSGGDDPRTLAVHNTLATLSRQDREVLRLAHWDDLPLPGIAAVLGISEAAARKRLQRASRRFAAAWATADYPAVSTSGPHVDTQVLNGAPGAVVVPDHTGGAR